MSLREDLSRSRIKLATELAPAFWCNPHEHYDFESAHLTAGLSASGDDEVFWGDELLRGGLVLPRTATDRPNALTILLTGPPGTGKTLFASRLCHNWAHQAKYWSVPDENPSMHRGPACTDHLKTWYITSEAHPPWFIDNISMLRWEHSDQFHCGSEPPSSGAWVKSAAAPSDVEELRKATPAGPTKDFWNRMLSVIRGQNASADPKDSTEADGPNPHCDVLVVDSLNTIPGFSDQVLQYRHLSSLRTDGYLVVIVVLDAAPADRAHHHWEFGADVVIRFAWRAAPSNYLVRTIEVSKARYQWHVWGQHQIRLSGPSGLLKRLGASPSDAAERIERLRAHPFMVEGGFTIYPSIHWMLSRYKTTIPDSTGQYVFCPVPKLSEALGPDAQSSGSAGFPKGRCTALTGNRGGHKSHLGYLQILGSVIYSRNSALVVSLQDDERSTIFKMQGVLEEIKTVERLGFLPASLRQNISAQAIDLDQLQEAGRLEVDYYHPGYITPEEFFNRVVLSVNRLRMQNGADITLFFNSVDQLQSKFPLCAAETSFMPGLVNVLNAEEVSSIFAMAGSGRPGKGEDSPLLSMADLILSFNRVTIRSDRYLKVAKRQYSGMRWPREAPSGKVSVVRMSVDRFASGRSAGVYGFLPLASNGSITQQVLGASGLFFMREDM